jgi:hypothetical protein
MPKHSHSALVTVLVTALVTAVVTLVAGTALATPATAKPPKPRAELVVTQVTAALTGGHVGVALAVKNKGGKAAPASTASLALSSDKLRSQDDIALGTVPVAKVKPKKTASASATFALPAGAAAGAYYVIACADSGQVVKERKEQNNCKATATAIAVAPATVTVSATAGTGGTVAASGITGGTCPSNVCTFPAGDGKVTFTPAASSGYRFGGWSGATCNGFTAGAGNAITFTNPTASKACTATFVQQVTISWTVMPAVIFGTVSGAATNGTCPPSDPLSGAGSCTVDAGVGTVTLTATATTAPIAFSSWSAVGDAVCDGTPTGNLMVLTAPTTAKGCRATFTVGAP